MALAAIRIFTTIAAVTYFSTIAVFSIATTFGLDIFFAAFTRFTHNIAPVRSWRYGVIAAGPLGFKTI